METFAFFSRVAASLKQLGLWGSFGIDEVCSKNAMSKVIIVDWTAPEGEEILMSWLNLPNVVRTGFCFSLRTCFKSMSMTVKKRKFSGKGDQFSSGVPDPKLSWVSPADQISHLTVK